MNTELGHHKDEGKPRVDLLDPEAMLGIAEVLTFGATKYAESNWRGGIKYSRIIGSILRHLFAIMRGEDLDIESGLLHIDHLGCDAMFLSYYMRNRKDLDDRYVKLNTTRGSGSERGDVESQPSDTGSNERSGKSLGICCSSGATSAGSRSPYNDTSGGKEIGRASCRERV